MPRLKDVNPQLLKFAVFPERRRYLTNAAKRLDKAADLLETKKWTRDTEARAADGKEVYPTPGAAQFCAIGAVRAVGADNSVCDAALELLGAQIGLDYDRVAVPEGPELESFWEHEAFEEFIHEWNDSDAKNKTMVVRVLRRAARNARKAVSA